MTEMPKSAEYIKSKLCFGSYDSCSRYRAVKKNPLIDGITDSSLEVSIDDLQLLIPDMAKDVNCQNLLKLLIIKYLID